MIVGGIRQRAAAAKVSIQIIYDAILTTCPSIVTFKFYKL